MIRDFNNQKILSLNRDEGKSLVNTVINSKQFYLLNHEQLIRFIDQHEIINCFPYMQNQISYNKLCKMYLLLFQISSIYGHKESIYNFLSHFDFHQKFNHTQNNHSISVSEKIIMKKISKFLNSFKIEYCLKLQINSLISQYHQFRLIQDDDRNLARSFCNLMECYIKKKFQQLLAQIVNTNWLELGESQFKEFYHKYSQLCTICKRIRYINCKFMNLSKIQIPADFSFKIEEKWGKINEIRKNQNAQYFKQQKIQQCQKPKLNTRKKLKAINNLIFQMQNTH